jgi:acyl-CoA synthetase (AMP-forming)/AMP-acid ligase II
VNIGVLLDVAAAMDPSRVVVSGRGTSLTLSQLRAAAWSFAQLLDRDTAWGPVAFVDVNGGHFPVALFGAAYAGRTFAPLNFRADAAGFNHYIDLLKPTAVVAGERYRRLLPEETAFVEPIVADGPNLATDAACEARGGADDVAVTVFSSGTAAAPKPIVLRHRHLTAYVLGSVEPLSEPETAASLIATPNYHIAAVANVLTSTYAGRRMIFLEQFTPEVWIDLARRNKATHAFLVPTMLHRVVEYLKDHPADLSDLKTIAYGGAAARRDVVEDALRLFPEAGFVNAYGLTETSSTVCVLGPEDHRLALKSDDPTVRARLSSVGRPLPGIQLRLSEQGEILVRGAQVSAEYQDRPGSVEPEGWFHTGDLGTIDDAGYVFITGRADDMIIRGGENISPIEIEDALRGFPGLTDVAVVGVDDKEWGQRIVAAVECQTFDGEALELWARRHLPSFKRPSRFVPYRALPRNDLGKLQRRRIAADQSGSPT